MQKLHKFPKFEIKKLEHFQKSPNKVFINSKVSKMSYTSTNNFQRSFLRSNIPKIFEHFLGSNIFKNNLHIFKLLVTLENPKFWERDSMRNYLRKIVPNFQQSR